MRRAPQGAVRSDACAAFALSAGAARSRGAAATPWLGRDIRRLAVHVHVCAPPRWRATLSERFLQPGSSFDGFPRVQSTPTEAADAASKLGINFLAPDILGVLTWSVALYFGFSQRRRLGTTLRVWLYKELLDRSVPDALSDAAATALHSLPFIAAAIGVDGFLRGALSDSFAAAGGLSLMLWSLVYELGRPKPKSEEDVRREREAWKVFLQFAEKRLERHGRCHFTDVSRAFRREHPRYRTTQTLSDEALKKFVRRWAPRSPCSRNGFYKELSVRSQADIFN